MNFLHTRRRGAAGRALATLAVGSVAVAALLAPGSATAADQRVKGWGVSSSWQLGGTETASRPTPSALPGLTAADVKALSAGGYSTDGFGLALLKNGTVDAWGRNGNGQLGDGTTSNHANPGKVAGLTRVAATAAGDVHALASLSDGTVRAWGYNGYGQLGDGTTTQRTTPVDVKGLTLILVAGSGGRGSGSD